MINTENRNFKGVTRTSFFFFFGIWSHQFMWGTGVLRQIEKKKKLIKKKIKLLKKIKKKLKIKKIIS